VTRWRRLGLGPTRAGGGAAIDDGGQSSTSSWHLRPPSRRRLIPCRERGAAPAPHPSTVVLLPTIAPRARGPAPAPPGRDADIGCSFLPVLVEARSAISSSTLCSWSEKMGESITARVIFSVHQSLYGMSPSHIKISELLEHGAKYYGPHYFF
jgi:hypothetical protein